MRPAKDASFRTKQQRLEVAEPTLWSLDIRQTRETIIARCLKQVAAA